MSVRIDIIETAACESQRPFRFHPDRDGAAESAAP